MSRYLYMTCECGAFAADHLSRRFEYAFLKDGLHLRDWLIDLGESPLPWGPTGDDVLVSAKGFVAWHDNARRLLEEHRSLLPVLNQIWLRNPNGVGASSSWAYFEWNGRGFVAEADDDEDIVLSEKPRSVFDSLVERNLKQGVRFVPKFELLAEESDLVRRKDGAITMPAPVFEKVFVGTGFELQRANLLDYYAADFRELANTAAHARSCGRPLRMYFV